MCRITFIKYSMQYRWLNAIVPNHLIFTILFETMWSRFFQLLSWTTYPRDIRIEVIFCMFVINDMTFMQIYHVIIVQDDSWRTMLRIIDAPIWKKFTNERQTYQIYWCDHDSDLNGNNEHHHFFFVSSIWFGAWRLIVRFKDQIMW